MRVRLVVALIVGFLACVAPAVAHPLGNFTVNHLARLTVSSSSIDVHYVLDEAEIPAFSVLRSLAADARPSHGALASWATTTAHDLAPSLALEVDGASVPLTLTGTTVRTVAGAAGLSTLRLTADYRAARPSAAQVVRFRDETFAGRIGWHDVVIAPEREPTDELRVYPSALAGSPRDVTAVDLRLAGNVATRTGGATASGAANATGRMNDLADVLARDLRTPLALLGALLVAVGLGALHALEPGHGKTLLAISLVGARATIRQAIVLATALTVAHTAGVLAFGIVALAFARWIVPEQLYPAVALASGLVVAGLGANALAREVQRRARRRNETRATRHARAAAAAFAALAHDHAQMDELTHARAHAVAGTAPLTFRSAVLAAASGNLAPCPAALVVLLAAVATHRVAIGLVVIVAFGLGLALTLTTLAIAVVRGAAWLSRRPAFDRAARFAPLLSAAVICLLGAAMIGTAVADYAPVLPGPLTAGLVLAGIAVVLIIRLTTPFASPPILTQGEPGS